MTHLECPERQVSRELNRINYLKLAINEDVIFPSVHFHANMFSQPTLKGWTIRADLRWVGRAFHILVIENRKYLAHHI